MTWGDQPEDQCIHPEPCDCMRCFRQYQRELGEQTEKRLQRKSRERARFTEKKMEVLTLLLPCDMARWVRDRLTPVAPTEPEPREEKNDVLHKMSE